MKAIDRFFEILIYILDSTNKAYYFIKHIFRPKLAHVYYYLKDNKYAYNELLISKQKLNVLEKIYKNQDRPYYTNYPITVYDYFTKSYILIYPSSITDMKYKIIYKKDIKDITHIMSYMVHIREYDSVIDIYQINMEMYDEDEINGILSTNALLPVNIKCSGTQIIPMKKAANDLVYIVYTSVYEYGSPKEALYRQLGIGKKQMEDYTINEF